MSTSNTTRNTTPTITSTVCTITKTLPLSDASFTSLTTTVTGSVSWSTSVYFIVLEYRKPTCDNYWQCINPPPRPNPDVAGLGVIIAFLVTAWASFIFLAGAYCSGYLPQEHIKRVDVALFRAHSKRCNEKWKKTLDKVMLAFSDQQLVTGLAIILAGFLQALNNDLDVYHWHMVIYLAWMSSTVHLTALSFLKDWLSRRTLLRNLRAFGMVVLFAFLAMAMYVQGDWNFTIVLYGGHYTLPVRCIWRGQSSSAPKWVGWNNDVAISYFMLCLGYVWKLSQVFETSRLWMRIFLATPLKVLEKAVNLSASMSPRRMTRAWILWRMSIFFYVTLIALYQALDSCISSVFFLFATLIWGTEQLLIFRGRLTHDVAQAENALSFGQLVALLLLLLPLSTIVEHFARRPVTTSRTYISTIRTSTSHTPNQASHRRARPSAAGHGRRVGNTAENESASAQPLNLTQVLTTADLLTYEERVHNSRSDPVLDHLYRTRSFKAGIWYLFLSTFILTMGVVCSLRPHWVHDKYWESIRYLLVTYGTLAVVAFGLILSVVLQSMDPALQ